jgi:putative spermidine/putrescine transport system permease protein
MSTATRTHRGPPLVPAPAPGGALRRGLRRVTLTGTLTWAGLLAFILGLIGAVGVVLLASFAQRLGAGWLPAGYTGHWYSAAWTDFGLQGLLAATFEIAVTVVLVSLLVGIPTAYVLARLKFPGKKLLLVLFLLPQVIPTMTYAVPLATLVYELHLNDTIAGVVLVNLVPSLPFAVLVLIPFVEQIDPRVEQAARVCGAGTFGVFRRVLAPLMIPGLLAAGVLILVRVVGQFELTFMVSGPHSQTMVIALYTAATQSGLLEGQELDAMAVLYMLTTLVLLLIALRFVDPTSVTRRTQRRS